MASRGYSGQRRAEVLIGGEEEIVKAGTAKLIVEEGRGVVYWTAQMFWEPPTASPQTCSLEGARGIFSEVKIRSQLREGPDRPRVD